MVLIVDTKADAFATGDLDILYFCQVIETDKDKDIHYYVASSLKALFVHGQCLNLVYKTHALLINQFLQQQFIPR